MGRKNVTAMLLSLFLLTACTNEKTQSQKEPEVSDNFGKPDSTEVIIEPDPWSEAVTTAIAAGESAQTAKTADEWKGAVDLWGAAIELMKSVPESSEHYETAQKKVLEYHPNLQYAQEREEAEARKEAIIANGGWEILHTFDGSGMTNFCPSNEVFSVERTWRLRWEVGSISNTKSGSGHISIQIIDKNNSEMVATFESNQELASFTSESLEIKSDRFCLLARSRSTSYKIWVEQMAEL